MHHFYGSLSRTRFKPKSFVKGVNFLLHYYNPIAIPLKDFPQIVSPEFEFMNVPGLIPTHFWHFDLSETDGRPP